MIVAIPPGFANQRTKKAGTILRLKLFRLVNDVIRFVAFARGDQTSDKHSPDDEPGEEIRVQWGLHRMVSTSIFEVEEADDPSQESAHQSESYLASYDMYHKIIREIFLRILLIEPSDHIGQYEATCRNEDRSKISGSSFNKKGDTACNA